MRGGTSSVSPTLLASEMLSTIDTAIESATRTEDDTARDQANLREELAAMKAQMAKTAAANVAMLQQMQELAAENAQLKTLTVSGGAGAVTTLRDGAVADVAAQEPMQPVAEDPTAAAATTTEEEDDGIVQIATELAAELEAAQAAQRATELVAEQTAELLSEHAAKRAEQSTEEAIAEQARVAAADAERARVAAAAAAALQQTLDAAADAAFSAAPTTATPVVATETGMMEAEEGGAASAAGSAAEDAYDLRRELAEFFTLHDPSKLALIDDMIADFGGRPDELLAAITAKYKQAANTVKFLEEEAVRREAAARREALITAVRATAEAHVAAAIGNACLAIAAKQTPAVRATTSLVLDGNAVIQEAIRRATLTQTVTLRGEALREATAATAKAAVAMWAKQKDIEASIGGAAATTAAPQQEDVSFVVVAPKKRRASVNGDEAIAAAIAAAEAEAAATTATAVASTAPKKRRASVNGDEAIAAAIAAAEAEAAAAASPPLVAVPPQPKPKRRASVNGDDVIAAAIAAAEAKAAAPASVAAAPKPKTHMVVPKSGLVAAPVDEPAVVEEALAVITRVAAPVATPSALASSSPAGPTAAAVTPPSGGTTSSTTKAATTTTTTAVSPGKVYPAKSVDWHSAEEVEALKKDIDYLLWEREKQASRARDAKAESSRLQRELARQEQALSTLASQSPASAVKVRRVRATLEREALFNSSDGGSGLTGWSGEGGDGSSPQRPQWKPAAARPSSANNAAGGGKRPATSSRPSTATTAPTGGKLARGIRIAKAPRRPHAIASGARRLVSRRPQTRVSNAFKQPTMTTVPRSDPRVVRRQTDRFLIADIPEPQKARPRRPAGPPAWRPGGLGATPKLSDTPRAKLSLTSRRPLAQQTWREPKGPSFAPLRDDSAQRKRLTMHRKRLEAAKLAAKQQERNAALEAFLEEALKEHEEEAQQPEAEAEEGPALVPSPLARPMTAQDKRIAKRSKRVPDLVKLRMPQMREMHFPKRAAMEAKAAHKRGRKRPQTASATMSTSARMNLSEGVAGSALLAGGPAWFPAKVGAEGGLQQQQTRTVPTRASLVARIPGGMKHVDAAVAARLQALDMEREKLIAQMNAAFATPLEMPGSEAEAVPEVELEDSAGKANPYQQMARDAMEDARAAGGSFHTLMQNVSGETIQSFTKQKKSGRGGARSPLASPNLKRPLGLSKPRAGVRAIQTKRKQRTQAASLPKLVKGTTAPKPKPKPKPTLKPKPTTGAKKRGGKKKRGKKKRKAKKTS